jgi:hypothetical protein
MKIFNIFFVSFVFACLLPLAVQARTLVGLSDWTVGKVDANIPYCTITKQFDADAILTIARNVRGEATVALNFQRDAFDLTRAYPVTLKVDNVLRQYVVKPANPSNLIMRTGSDLSLFNAMQTIDLLSVTIDNETFKLDVSGYAKASTETDTCLGVMNTPVVVETKTPRPPIVQDTVVQNEKIDQLIAENKVMAENLATISQPKPSSDNVELLQRLATSERKNVTLLSTINQLEQQLKQLETSVNPDLNSILAEKDRQIDMLVDQNNQLKNQIETLRSQPKPQLQLSGDQIDDEAMIRISEAETQAKVYAAERDEYRRLLQVERDRIREMGGLAKTIEGKEGDTQNLTENIRRLEIEKADLIRKLEFERSSQKAGMETAGNSSESLMQLSDQLDFMKAELQKIDQEKNDLALQLDRSATAAKLAQQELAELKTSIENNGQALDTEAELQTQTLLADIATLEAENAKLRQDVNQQALKTSALPVTDTPQPDMQMLRRLNIIEAENQRLMKELSEKPKQMPKVSTIAKASPPVVKSTPNAPQSISRSVQPQQPTILSGDSIRRVIKQSNIPLKSPIQRVERTAQTNFAAFTWDTGVVYGNAEQAKMKSGQQFDQAVQGYLQKTAKRCKGTFDQEKTNVQLSMPAQSYDIACIDNNGTSGHAASIVFFEKEGMFHAIAHEGGIQQFQIAMDMRDRVVNAIQTIY